MRYAGKLSGLFQQQLHRIEEYECTGSGLAIVRRPVVELPLLGSALVLPAAHAQSE